MKRNFHFFGPVAVILPIIFFISGCNQNNDILSYKVTFNSNQGSAVDAQTVEKSSKVSLPPNPSRAGFNFVSWYKDTAFSQPFSCTEETISANTVLYAAWESSFSYTVTFNTIGDFAFLRADLTAITLPSSVTEIGASAFNDNNALTSVRVEATNPPILGARQGIYNTFGLAKGLSIMVPLASLAAYRTALGWSGYAAAITGY